VNKAGHFDFDFDDFGCRDLDSGSSSQSSTPT
jgi:hypothetical protein